VKIIQNKFGQLEKLFLVSVVLSTFFSSPPAYAMKTFSTLTTSHPTSSSHVSIDFSGGLVTMGGNYGGTFLLGVALPVSRTSPVKIELQSGVTFASGTALPILLSVLYDFANGARQNVTPYIGGSVGPVIGLSSNLLDLRTPLVGSGIQLAILVRPGLKFNVTDNLDLTIEAPLGGMTGVFYIAPTVGIMLRV
jgi:hypothetical protein